MELLFHVKVFKKLKKLQIHILDEDLEISLDESFIYVKANDKYFYQ
jgi:hypothetical protein